MTEFNSSNLTPDDFKAQKSFTDQVEEVEYNFTKKHTISDVLPGYRYIVRVRALNNYNVYSDWSEAVDFVVPADATIPSAPSNLIAAFYDVDVIVRWTPPSTNVDGSPITDISYYQLTFSCDAGTKTYYSAPSQYTLSYALNTADFGSGGYPSSDFDIEVRTVDTSGNLSDPVTTTVSHTPPDDPPEDPVLTEGINSISVRMANTGIFDSISALVYYTFELHESEDDGGSDPYAIIYEGGSNIYDHPVSSGTTHYYKYKIIDPFGYETAFSNAVDTTSLTAAEVDHTHPPDYTTIFMMMGA